MANERVFVFQHIAGEDLGSFAEVLAARGLHAHYVRLFAGDTVPADAEQAAALAFLGGPMSVNDEHRYAYLAPEKALIRRALAHGTPVLGVCLGAQLLAAAAGARVFPGVRPEIGWAPVSLTPDGRRDAILAGVAEVPAVFHWHGETFDLPAGATRLASSAVTPNQAFRLGSRAYGLQFHLEVTPAMINAWLREYAADLVPDAVAIASRVAADTVEFAQTLRTAAAAAVHRFVDLVAAQADAHAPSIDECRKELHHHAAGTSAANARAPVESDEQIE
jgi:GMP synthase (glutamine-hydrolysing)